MKRTVCKPEDVVFIEKPIGNGFNDLDGKTFGYLLVIGFAGYREAGLRDRPTWYCQCSCKNKTLVLVGDGSLLHSPNISCGCYKPPKKEPKIKYTANELMNKLQKLHGELSYTVLGDYKNWKSHILVENEYGKCLVSGGGLINGTIPSIVSAVNKTEYWINQAIEIHGDRYDYSLAEYSTNEGKIKIICKIHGVFEQRSSSHILKGHGCPKCGFLEISISRSTTLEDFIYRSNLIHNDFYSYELIEEFHGQNKNYDFMCPIHGKFSQLASNHISGGGCILCRNEKAGFDKQTFLDSAERYKGNAEIYLIRCWNQEEEFYKIGITARGIESRFKTNKLMPYNYEILLIIKGNPDSIWNCEDYLMEKYKYLKHRPSIKFHGWYECFNLSLPIETICETLTNLKTYDTINSVSEI